MTPQLRRAILLGIAISVAATGLHLADRHDTTPARSSKARATSSSSTSSTMRPDLRDAILKARQAKPCDDPVGFATIDDRGHLVTAWAECKP